MFRRSRKLLNVAVIVLNSTTQVQIHGLHNPNSNFLLQFDRPCRAIAIDPQFCARNSARRFVTGGDRVQLHERNFLLGYKVTPLHSGDIVRNIKWRGQFIAWASDTSVKIFDSEQRTLITVIRRDHDPRLRPEIYRCNLHWKNDKTLLIGWGDSVKVCHVRDKDPPPANPTVPTKYVEISKCNDASL